MIASLVSGRPILVTDEPEAGELHQRMLPPGQRCTGEHTGHAQVTRERQLESASECRSIDCGNSRQRERFDLTQESP